MDSHKLRFLIWFRKRMYIALPEMTNQFRYNIARDCMKNEICGLGGVMSGCVNLVKWTRPDYLLKNRDKIFVQTFPGHYTPIYDTYPYSNYLTLTLIWL